MARETKVGLIVGLGVILFVSVFVSDYISDPSRDEAMSNQPLPDFERTTNQTPMPVADDTDLTPGAIDPREMAAVSLEQAERRDGPAPTVQRRVPEGVPPVRRGPPSLSGGFSAAEAETPPAYDPYRAPRSPVGARALEEDDRSHQLTTDRLGSAGGIDDDVLRVPINPEPLIAARSQQIRHTVEAGQTLSQIARQYYDGDGNMWRSIRDANRGLVGPNGEVEKDAVLIIPKRSTEAVNEFVEAGASGVSGSNAPQRQRVRMVTVQSGDSLSELAAQHLGSAGDWKRIMAVNPELDKPEHITIGMKLRIPVDAPEPAESTGERERVGTDTVERDRPADPPATRTYTVKAGDNLYRIAAKMLDDGERFNEIYQANRGVLDSPDDLKPGMELKLPER